MIRSTLVALTAHATVLTLLGRRYANFLDLVATSVCLPTTDRGHDDLLLTIIRSS